MFQTADTSRFTVLLAGDAPAQRPAWQATVGQLLAPMGVQTVSARSGREALDLIQAGQVHVAVLDVDMPQIGGLAVIKRMQMLDTAPPAILLARQLSAQLLHEALGMKVFSVLGKPVDFNMLLDALARVIRRHYEGRWPV
jgi:DNA-binding NtrC family response regulator